MSWRCPQGHDSGAGDWCDVCGAPIDAGDAGDAAADERATGSVAAVSGPPAGAAPAHPTPGGDGAPDLPGAGSAGAESGERCPHCGAAVSVDALFCEACGTDLTTGALPPPPAPPPAGPDEVVSHVPGDDHAGGDPVWVAELWVDPDWYDAQDAQEPCPSPGAPTVVTLRKRSVLVGRPSASRNIHPDVDCGADTGVSRRHAQLTTDGLRWWVEDLRSANGTYVGAAGAPLPTEPIAPGQRREVAGDERIYLGAWTRLVLREATPEERAG